MVCNKVSIIIPCFNNSSSIGETLDSVINQSYDNWEVICVDDGSEDNTCDIVNHYAENDSRIHFINRDRTPKGGSVCRNIGIEKAVGEYLIFLDADDLLQKDCLKKRVERLANNTLDFAVFPFASISDGVVGKVSSDARIKKHFLAFSSNHAVWQTSCPIYRKSFVEKVGGFDESFPRLQDVEFGTRCLAESIGNYKSFLSEIGEADCFYRSSQSKKEFTRKYDLAFSTLPKFYKLITHLREQNKYSRKDFSKALLCLLLSAIMISRSTTNKASYLTVFPEDASNYLLLSDKLVLRLLGLTVYSGSLYYKLAHLIRYIIFRIYF